MAPSLGAPDMLGIAPFLDEAAFHGGSIGSFFSIISFLFFINNNSTKTHYRIIQQNFRRRTSAGRSGLSLFSLHRLIGHAIYGLQERDQTGRRPGVRQESFGHWGTGRSVGCTVPYEQERPAGRKIEGAVQGRKDFI